MTLSTSRSNFPNIEVVFAADLGGTHLRTATIDRNGTISNRQKQATPQSEQPDQIVHALIEALHECETQHGGPVSAISVAVPGTVNVAEGLVITAPNLESLDGFQLGPALMSEIERAVTIENDANAAALGEWWQGAGRGFQTLICITLGTGVGGGIILEEKLWRGADGSAGEVGHISVDPFGGVVCGCGSTGCLEVYASATAIVRMTREMKPRYSESTLSVTDELTSERIFNAGSEGDPLALKVFNRMGTYLGVGVASLINLFNPELIVIGGGVSNAWELFEKSMHEQISKRAFAVPARRAKVVKAECGDNAGLLGAARLAFEANSSEFKL